MAIGFEKGVQGNFGPNIAEAALLSPDKSGARMWAPITVHIHMCMVTMIIPLGDAGGKLEHLLLWQCSLALATSYTG